MAQPNPILAQFRAAGKLINEWRDTLTYGALGAATAAGLVSPDTAAYLFVGREAYRAAGWFLDKAPAYVGSRMPVDNDRMMLSAITMALAGGVCDAAIQGFAATAAVVVPVTALTGIIAGGPRAILAAYRDVMWDYPRKKDDGGTTQTQKLQDGSKELLQDLVDQVTPAPTPVPVPVRARVVTLPVARP